MVSDFRAINNLIKLLFFSVFLLTGACVLADNKLIPIPKDAVNSTVANNGLAQTKSADSARLFSPKIVGGTNASRGEFPEFVQLFIEGAVIGLDPAFLYPWCGGSLISANKVLTAAHCTSGLGLRDFYALPNFYTYNDNITFADLIPISSKVEHPNYQQQTAFDYDVSIITLSQSFGANTAKLFSGRDPLVDFNATLIGTGVLSEGGLEPTTLQKVTVPIVSNAVCKRSYGDSAITDRMICAGLQTGTKDSCNGDSGGPLWVEYDGQKTQAGIVSWGNGCARPNFYGVNTRVSAVIDFILQHAPDTKIVEQKPSNLISVLNLLLLDDSTDNGNPRLESCDDEEINIDEPISTRVLDFCIDLNQSPSIYYKSVKFTLQNNERVSINALAESNQINRLHLFSGTGVNKSLMQSFQLSDGWPMAVDMKPGDYTLIVRTFSANIDIDISLQIQNCDFVPIEFDTATEFNFQHNCLDTGINRSYVSHHSFSIQSDQQISALAVSNSIKEIGLYRLENGLLRAASNQWYAPANKDAFMYPVDIGPGDYVIKLSSLEEDALVSLRVNTKNCVTTNPISNGESVLVSYSDDCKNIWNRYQNNLLANVSSTRPVLVRSDKLFFVFGITSDDVNGEHVFLWTFNTGDNNITSYADKVNDTQTIKLDYISCDSQPITITDSVLVEFSELCRTTESEVSDYRVFTLTKNTNLKITAKSASNKSLILYEGTGNNLTHITSEYCCLDEDSIIEKTLSPGTYTIKSSTDDWHLPFNLMLEEFN